VTYSSNNELFPPKSEVVYEANSIFMGANKSNNEENIDFVGKHYFLHVNLELLREDVDVFRICSFSSGFLTV